jgi:hypothetical protein
MLRVDLCVRSHEPLVIPGKALSPDDVHAKLEALSSVLAGDVLACSIIVYPTTLDADPALFGVEEWRNHWYCVCGGVSLVEVATCPRCGRSRQVGELRAWARQATRSRT